MKNIVTRSLSGLVYIALIVSAILFGGRWGFPALCALFAIIGVAELHHLCKDSSEHSHTLGVLDMVGALILVIGPSALLIAAGDSAIDMLPVGASALSAYLIYIIARLVCQLYLPQENAIHSLSAGFMSQVYIALPLCCAAMLYLVCGKALVLTMFVLIWLNDTGAFCVGSAIGRHRLFERISPKKSWEGFFGGLFFAIAAGLLIKIIWPLQTPGWSLLQMGILGAVVSVFATWGDLAESLIKRTAHVKDSGHIMPGHGGILDRIDSLLLVAPATVCYITILLMFR